MTFKNSFPQRIRDSRALPFSEMQAIMARFEERVDAAHRALPPDKEAVRSALRRKGAARCPVRMKRLSMDVVVRYGDALADLFCAFPDDVIHIQPYEFCLGYQAADAPNRLNELQVLLQPGEWLDEWGTRWGHASGGVGATPVDYPLKDWSQLDDYLRGRMPDPHAPGRRSRRRWCCRPKGWPSPSRRSRNRRAGCSLCIGQSCR